jgi:hypothetical protein
MSDTFPVDDRTTTVTVRVGDRREYVVGHLACDPTGRVRLEQLAELLTAVAEHMRVLVDHTGQREPEAKPPKRYANILPDSSGMSDEDRVARPEPKEK